MKTAFGPPPIDDSLEGSPSYKGYDSNNLARLQSLGGQNTPSPATSGPPPEGALGAPEQSGGSSFLGQPSEGAIDAEPAKDMISYMDEASDEDFDIMRETQTEAYAAHGKSLEGAMADALQKGGPESWARAAKFGIDLTPFATAGDPTKSSQTGAAIIPEVPGEDPMQKTDKAVGQAFGNVPTDEQSASGMPYKDQDKATDEMQQGRKDLRKAEDQRKKNQRARIGYFLMEAGLRTLASERDDAAGAMAEGALGAMDSSRNRQREAAAQKMMEEDRARRMKREDESDSIQRQKEMRDKEAAERDRVAKITDKDGNVIYAPIVEGQVVYPEGHEKAGQAVREATDADLSAGQQATNEREYNRLINNEIKAVKKEIEDGVEGYDEIMDLPQAERYDRIRTIAIERIGSGAATSSEETDYLDW